MLRTFADFPAHTTTEDETMANRARHLKSAVLLTVPAAIAVISAAPASADGTWASIAYSPETSSYGYSYNIGTKGEAESVAMGYCYQYGGTDCQIASSASHGCLALADSSDHWAGGLGVSQGAAEADALADNGGGSILVSGCTGG
jgi:uncharacterized protein DUF4189